VKIKTITKEEYDKIGLGGENESKNWFVPSFNKDNKDIKDNKEK
jgi:hypothetical protein